jgi:hypothetical protein
MPQIVCQSWRDTKPRQSSLAGCSLSAAIFRIKRAPAWTAKLGFVIAPTAGWLTLLIPVADVFAIITFVGFAGFWVWMIALGVILWRSPDESVDALG